MMISMSFAFIFKSKNQVITGGGYSLLVNRDEEREVFTTCTVYCCAGYCSVVLEKYHILKTS